MTAALLPRASLAAAVLIVVFDLVFILTNEGSGRGLTGSPAADLVVTIAFLAFSVAGVLVAGRHPGNMVGWLFCAVGLDFPVAWLTIHYGGIGLSSGLWGAPVMAWLSAWVWALGFSPFVAALLLFPTGRLPSPRWRAAVLALLGGSALQVAGYGLGGNPLYAYPSRPPFAVPFDDATLGALRNWGTVLLLVSLLAAAASLVVRYRRSGGNERQQLKWLVLPAILLAVSTVPTGVITTMTRTQADAVSTLAYILPVTTFAVAVGFAMLRYRLYDIDVLINRTLVYGATITTVGAVFAAVVLVLQALLRPLTGGSDLAIAGSTLATVAAFQPLRRRIQAAVDHRFYRSRYDAARTLDAFTVRMRDQVDLDDVRGGLLDVVHDTLRPVHASVWLRGPGPLT